VKIIIVHNFYRQAGGEDQVFTDESALLESHGHTVIRHTVHNDTVNETMPITLAGKTIWNRTTHGEIFEMVRRHQADVVHFHNTFPLLSPAVLHGARDAGAAVVQTLHNYRLMCPTATFFRDGHVCEDCAGKAFAWPAVAHACYRNNRGASAAAAAMLAFHRIRGTYHDDVDAFIALTEFARGKFITAGLPPGKITVKPNFVAPDPGSGNGTGGYALFVGRLNETKGVGTLLEAWKKLPDPIILKIAGDGDMAPQVRAAAEVDPRIHWLGRQPLDEVYRLMGDAAVLIFPSLWYEGMPKTIIESFVKGTPVIASRLGSMAELVETGRTGALFTPGDANDLAGVVARTLGEASQLRLMRSLSRSEYERKYMVDRNYRMLLDIYRTALGRRIGSAAVSLNECLPNATDSDSDVRPLRQLTPTPER
jgi:glycosyltransferase involved in cell wall biosynthesis